MGKCYKGIINSLKHFVNKIFYIKLTKSPFEIIINRKLKTGGNPGSAPQRAKEKLKKPGRPADCGIPKERIL